MSEKKNRKTTSGLTRSAFWTSAFFYGFIAFEFFYMFSPFAVYFYGVYGPGLELLNLSGSTSWLISFFMPHIARETQSLFITWHEAIGMIFFIGGLLGFIIGAVQIYWSKLTKKGTVSGGIYVWIRHPQYLALMISSFGMVLIWPRYLVLFGFVIVCFAYYFLARTEEKICSQKFSDYDDYRSETGMFLPIKIEQIFSNFPWPKKRILKFVGVVTIFLVSLSLFFGVARAVHLFSIDSLFTHATEKEVFLSLGRIEPTELAELVHIAKSDSSVIESLKNYKDKGHRFINYVMPADLYVSEVPMYIPDGQTPTHQWPGDQDQSRYKIIFTKAHFGPGVPPDGLKILMQAVNKSPLLEVWIDRTKNQVEKVLGPSAKDYYRGMPVPVF